MVEAGRRTLWNDIGVMQPSERRAVRVSAHALVRPLANGQLVAVSLDRPAMFSGVDERCLAVCQRVTNRSDLVEHVSAAGGVDREAVEHTVADLIERGVLEEVALIDPAQPD